MKTVRVFLLTLCVPWLAVWSRAAEPVLPLRTNDVIAFIGGANMVALAQSGGLEASLTRQHPNHKLRFRSLAWEGDTVFAQPRDVNYPDLVTQLKQVGATVALVQFGEMESFAGKEGLTNFVKAYEGLLDRISASCPRILLLRPKVDVERAGMRMRYGGKPKPRDEDLLRYSAAVRNLASARKGPVNMYFEGMLSGAPTSQDPVPESKMGSEQQRAETESLLFQSLAANRQYPNKAAQDTDLQAAIAEKNRLWFEYARPSNWAFLAGDRTDQAFSRDYRDRNIRAFAEEMKQFVPLIADAEKRIDELAAKAAEKESAR